MASWRSAAPRTVALPAALAIDCSLRTRVPGYFTPCGQDLTLDPQSCWRHEPDRTLEDLEPLAPSHPPHPARTAPPAGRARDLPAAAGRLPRPVRPPASRRRPARTQRRGSPRDRG